MPPAKERRSFWAAVSALCAIAVVVSIRRLAVLAAPLPAGGANVDAIDVVFSSKPALTAGHVSVGLILALAIPVQFSARIRNRYRRVHRWLGRFLMLVGLLVGVSAFGMMARPVGGWLERSATGFYDTAFLFALGTAWWHVRHRDVAQHREWMLRASAFALGIATTRPVMAIFFATSAKTGLTPPDFFGVAMWIGFTSTALAAEAYIRSTRPAARVQSTAVASGVVEGVSAGR
jgi:Predicted membrane protein (DUF2306)